MLLKKKMLGGPSPYNYSNVSLSSGQFPIGFSHAPVKPLLKKQSADSEILNLFT